MATPIQDAARYYIENGLPLIAIPPINGRPVKGPVKKGWQKHPLVDAGDVSILSEHYNIGLLLTELTDVDVDMPQLCEIAKRRLPKTEFSWGRKTNPNSHFVYRIPEIKFKKFSFPANGSETKDTIIEIRHGNLQSILPPSTHEASLETYEFSTNSDSRVPADWTKEDCLVVVSTIAALGLLTRYWKKGMRFFGATALAGAMARNGWKWERAETFFADLADLTNDRKLFARARNSYERIETRDGNAAGIPSLHDLFGRDVTKKLLDWLELEGQADERWVEEMQAKAREAGHHADERPEPIAAAPQPEPTCQPTELLYQDLNDTGNAERLLAVYGRNILYEPDWKKWLIWDGMRWRKDEKDKIRSLARSTMGMFAAQAARTESKELKKFAKKSLNTAKISNSIKEGMDQRAVLHEELDFNRDLLNFQNGTLNLRTGEFFKIHERAHHITKLIHCDFDPNSTCEIFTEFVEQIVGLEQYPVLIRALGYSLTGHTSEKCIFVCWGPTNTGKTTLLDLFSEYIFREYSVVIKAESLMSHGKQDSNTSSDLADLFGARFAQSSETREGQKIDDATLKRITPGQGLIRAVRKYENPFTFSPTHALWIDTNHSIVTSSSGDDVFGRIIPFEFGPRISNDKIDRKLPLRLRSEICGIYALLTKEAQLWYTSGLGKLPEKITDVRAEWQDAANLVKRFVNEWCDFDIAAGTLGRPLFQAYELWAKEGNEPPMSETMFCRKMKELAKDLGTFTSTHSRQGSLYAGISLNNIAQERILVSAKSPDRKAYSIR
jgi:putative DNA primase/helicase